MEPAAAHPNSVNNCLADYLDSRKSAIYEEWLQRAHQIAPPNDAYWKEWPPTHIPALVDGLNAVLRNSFSPQGTEVDPEVTRDGCRDSCENPSSFERLSGIRLFRTIVLYYLRTFEDLHPDHGMAAMLFVSTIVHRFLDDAMIELVLNGPPPTARVHPIEGKS